MTTVKLKLFKPGQEVFYNGGYYRVSHVTISGYDIFLQLEGEWKRVNSNYVECELTEISLVRNNGE